METED
jgi:hypothetical protein